MAQKNVWWQNGHQFKKTDEEEEEGQNHNIALRSNGTKFSSPILTFTSSCETRFAGVLFDSIPNLFDFGF